MTLTRKLAKTNKQYVVFASMSLQIICKSEAMEEAQNLQLKFSSQLHSFLKCLMKDVLHYTSSRQKMFFDGFHHLTLSCISLSSWMELHVIFVVLPPPSFVSICNLSHICSLQFKCIWICIISEIPLPQVILVYFCNIFVFPLKSSSNCSGCSQFFIGD